MSRSGVKVCVKVRCPELKPRCDCKVRGWGRCQGVNVNVWWQCLMPWSDVKLWCRDLMSDVDVKVWWGFNVNVWSHGLMSITGQCMMSRLRIKICRSAFDSQRRRTSTSFDYTVVLTLYGFFVTCLQSVSIRTLRTTNVYVLWQQG